MAKKKLTGCVVPVMIRSTQAFVSLVDDVIKQHPDVHLSRAGAIRLLVKLGIRSLKWYTPSTRALAAELASNR